MVIYFVLYSAIGFTALFIKNLKADYTKRRFLFCMIAFVLLVLLFSVRHPSMGVDLQYDSTNGYIGQFQQISQLSFTELFSTSILSYEIGFVIFNKLISYISTDVQFYLFACTFFAVCPITYVIYKYSKSPLFSFLIYIGLPSFLMLFSGMRQILAIGLCTIALKFIFEKKLFKFIITVIFASLFHYSASIFLIAYPCYYLKFNNIGRVASLILIGLIFVFRVPIFNFLSQLYKEEAEIDNNGAIGLFIVFVLVYVYCFIFSKTNTDVRGLLNIFFLACVCQAFSGIYSTAMRIGYYFMIPLILLLPNVVNKIDDVKVREISYIFISVAFIIFGLISIYNSSWAMSYPYYFFWETVV